jgi:hypothetical protein
LCKKGGVSVNDESDGNEQSFTDGAFHWNNNDEDEDQQNRAAYYEAQQTSTAKREVQTRRRNQSHILLVGDPGTGVSLDRATILRAAFASSLTVVDAYVSEITIFAIRRRAVSTVGHDYGRRDDVGWIDMCCGSR